MLFSIQTLLLGINLPTVLQMVSATPIQQDLEVPAGLRFVEQYQSQSDNGTITWYAETAPSKRTPPLSKRACGENKLDCPWGTFKRDSPQYSCDALIEETGSGPKANEAIPFDSHSVCYGNPTNQCRILWGNKLQDAQYRDLVNAARKISKNCAHTIPPPVLGGRPRVNGRTTGMLLGGLCTVECLAARPDYDCGRS